jgi:undecaprenyl-diphosphatase
VFFLLLPAFQANAQICTQDGPLILCWIALAGAGLRLVRRWEAGTVGAADWLLFALLLGVAFLIKQSALLFVLGPATYALIRRRHLAWPPRLALHCAAAAACFAVVVSPMIVWNARHGWPTFAHTLGHLGAPGGDHAVAGEPRFDPRWLLTTAGAQVGAFGPAGILLMGLAAARAVRSRSVDPARFADRLWMLCCALPAIGFYLALSLVKPVLGNWPFPCFATLVVLVGEVAAEELPRFRDRLGAWRAGGKSGPRPRALFRSCWDVAVGYGLVACAILSFPVVLAGAPVAGKLVRKGLLTKMTGHRAAAATVQAARDRARARTGGEPLVVARYYMSAALYAFYLPDHPVVFNAGAQLGKRHTAYDYWTETDLGSPALVGRDALLDGVGAYPWEKVLRFGPAEPIDGGRFTLAHAYAGVRPPRERLEWAKEQSADDKP